MPILELPVNEITQYVLLCWYFLFNIILLNFVYVVAYISNSLFIQSLVDGHLSCVQFRFIMNKAAVDISAQVLQPLKR